MATPHYARLGAALVESAAEWAGVEPEIIYGRSQRLHPSMARQGVMYVLQNDHGWTLTDIADLLKRDHSTIAKGAKRFEALIPNDDDAFDVATRLRQVALVEEGRGEMNGVRDMALATIEMTKAGKVALDSMERAARRVLRMTEGYQ